MHRRCQALLHSVTLLARNAVRSPIATASTRHFATSAVSCNAMNGHQLGQRGSPPEQSTMESLDTNGPMGLPAPTRLQPRAYQLEMLRESLERNIIVAVRALNKMTRRKQLDTDQGPDGYWQWEDTNVRNFLFRYCFPTCADCSWNLGEYVALAAQRSLPLAFLIGLWNPEDKSSCSGQYRILLSRLSTSRAFDSTYHQDYLPCLFRTKASFLQRSASNHRRIRAV